MEASKPREAWGVVVPDPTADGAPRSNVSNRAALGKGRFAGGAERGCVRARAGSFAEASEQHCEETTVSNCASSMRVWRARD
jgi:hypothetical protein